MSLFVYKLSSRVDELQKHNVAGVRSKLLASIMYICVYSELHVYIYNILFLRGFQIYRIHEHDTKLINRNEF